MKNYNCEFTVFKFKSSKVMAISEGPAVEQFKKDLTGKYGFTEKELKKGHFEVSLAEDDQ